MNTLSEIIKTRRSIKPESFSPIQIPQEDIEEILESAIWAPTHGRTEPWSFYVFSKEGRKVLGQYMHQAYLEITAPDQRDIKKEEQLKNRPLLASHIICVTMVRGHNQKIPVQEELLACGSAIQNMLLSAEQKSIASFWSTGALIHASSFRQHLKLRPEDEIVGIIYLGGKPSEAPALGKRNHGFREKCQFIDK